MYSLIARQAGQNAPSGIAQLRKSSEQANLIDDNHMNLDDFIVPSSIGTPAGVSPAASSNVAEEETNTGRSGASAIPIKQHQRIQAEELHLSRASAPSATAIEKSRATGEFDYVPRHVRKTSIDERAVRLKSSGDVGCVLTVSESEATSRSIASSPSHWQQ